MMDQNDEENNAEFKRPLLNATEMDAALVADYARADSPRDEVAAARVWQKISSELGKNSDGLRTKRPVPKRVPILMALLAACVVAILVPQVMDLKYEGNVRSKGDILSAGPLAPTLVVLLQVDAGQWSPINHTNLREFEGRLLTFRVTAPVDEYSALILSRNNEPFAVKSDVQRLQSQTPVVFRVGTDVYGYRVEAGDRSLVACAVARADTEEVQSLVDGLIAPDFQVKAPECVTLNWH